MKYRIKHYILKNGNHIYEPQYRKFFFWKSWTYSPGIDLVCNYTFPDLSGAIDFLNLRFKEISREKGRKIKQITYINL